MKIIRIVIMSIMFGIFAVAALATDKVSAVPVIVDVRTEAEWNEGHLDGAVLIPHDKIEEGITAAVPDKGTKIYLYCRSGRRTGIALEALKKAGYQDMISLDTLENAAKELQKPIVK